MRVEKQTVKQSYAACNFCNGNVNHATFQTTYNYDFVYTFIKDNGNGLQASICAKCLKDLNQQVKEIETNKQ